MVLNGKQNQRLNLFIKHISESQIRQLAPAMIQTVEILFPILFTIICGCLAANKSWLKPDFFALLAKLVLYFFLPVTLILTVSKIEIQNLILRDYLGIYTLASLLAFCLTYGLVRYFSKTSHHDASVYAVGGSFSNSIYIGYPILLTLFESLASQILIMTIVVETIIMLPFALTLIEGSRDDSASRSKNFVGRLLKNPVILAVIFGVALSSIGLTLPSPLENSLQSISACTTPLALFVVGGSILFHQTQPSKKPDKLGEITFIVIFGKLLLHPLCAAFIIWLWAPIDQSTKLAILLLSALPTFISYPVIMGPYGLRHQCSKIVAIGTLISLVTLGITISIIL